jgi:5-formyltetrahydrofolate cyclo-ligase
VPLLTEVSAAKQASRARQRARLARLAPDERRARSANLVAHLVQLPVWQAARRVLLFAPLAGEPDLDLLWLGPGLAGKQCAYPRATGHGQMHLRVVRRLEELQPTRWGLREPPLEGADPVTLEDLDLVLVPGLAFDEKGARLGRGGGFYDRLLAARPATTRTMGVAFAFQIKAKLPGEPHDVPMDALLTDAGVRFPL